MKIRKGPKRSRSEEEAVLWGISMPPVQVTADEAQTDESATTSSDYDRLLLQAIRERKEERIEAGYGSIGHPTTRIFEIGIESIRANKPSNQFLRLLEKIGQMAEDNDVMATMFPAAFPRRIKKTTIRAAQRDAKIVDDFKAHVRKYLEKPPTATVSGDEDKGGKWEWNTRTYAEAMSIYKSNMNTDKRKVLDRALEKHGPDILGWRDAIAEKKKMTRK